MKFQRVLILLFPIIFFHCTNERSYPKIILDDKYSQIQPVDSKIAPLKYQVASLKGFILDCSGYNFKEINKLNHDKYPDQIFLISKAGNYSIDLNVRGETVVDSTTMYNLDRKNMLFPGFTKGDTVVFAIGAFKSNKRKVEMMTFWMARIEIK